MRPASPRPGDLLFSQIGDAARGVGSMALKGVDKAARPKLGADERTELRRMMHLITR